MYKILVFSEGVAYPGVRDNRSTINTKTGYDDDDDCLYLVVESKIQIVLAHAPP